MLVKDVLDFELYPNWLSRPTLVIPRYLTFETLNDLTSTYLNGLFKAKFGLEIKDKDQWFSESGKKLISSFLLTEQAKKFLISRNMYSLIDEPIFGYFSLMTILIHVPLQFIKWKRDLTKAFEADLDFKGSKDVYKLQEHSKKFFFLKYKNLLLATIIATYIYLIVILYYATGLKNSRDADAQTVSHGLALGVSIKSKTSLMDFNYYSGGEEAYRKMIERNRSLNQLIFKEQIRDWIRLLKRIPFSEDSNELNIFSNQVPIKSAYDNLNEWEKNSG